jgi:hypothetical protein
LGSALFGSFFAVAEEEAAEAAVEATEEAAATEGEAAEEESLTDEEKMAKVADQGKELVEKLSHLKELIAAKGDKVSGSELESLKKLEQMLGDTLGGGLGGLAAPQAGKDAEVTQFFAACTMMSMARAGSSRANTQGSLRRMADGKLTPADAADSDLWRMTVSCLTRLTDDEFDRFKAGTLKLLPKEYVDAAKLPEAREEVVKVDPGHWAELQVVAKSIAGDAPEPASTPPIAYIALVIVVAVVIFLGKKFMDMLNEKEEKGSKKKKTREGPKSK